ncbi:hypothetical protein JCM1841_006561 [Sporobolomyces salmonicolor]
MSVRPSASVALKSIPSARSFASTSTARLPPKQKLGSKAALWARNKKSTTEGDDAASTGSGAGNVLSEVTLPPPDLSGVQVMHPESLTKAAVGDVRAFPAPALDVFKALSVPSSTQKEHAFTSKPATVVRNATLKITSVLDAGRTASSKESRHILDGGAGTGKSTLLLQAVSYAATTGWVVLYLPSATPLVNSSTPHLYSSARHLFDQPVLSASLLTKFSTANKAAFKALKTTQEWAFGERKVAQGKPLEELCKVAGGDEKIVTSVFEAVMEELTVQKERPVLLAIDDAQSLFAPSAYVDPTYQAIETFSLIVPRMLLEFVSGQRTFATGSVLLSASSLSAHSSLAMTDFLSPPPASALPSAYDRARLASYPTYASILAAGVQKLPVPARLDRTEAVGIVQLLQGWRGVREKVSDPSFLERLVAADGNPREFAKALSRNRAV